MGDGYIRVLRTYTFSELGRDLYEAGHVAGSREYAVGDEPFKWSCDERAMAYHGLGHECDDSAAYPRARMAMTAAGRDISATFLLHRKHIMRAAGAYLFAEEKEEDQLKRLKAVTNAFDMDSALDAWIHKYGNPHGRTLRGHNVTLPDGTSFSLQAYRAAQVHTTAWMAARLQSMIMLIQSLHKVGSPTHAKAPRTAKSFVLQEAEAAARNAKIAWCHAHGKRVISLQHDGILVADIVPGSEPQTAAALSAAATAQCGYDVKVEVKA